MSKELAKRGYNIIHIYSKSCGGPKAEFNTNSSKTLRVVDVEGKKIRKDNFFARYLEERQYGLKIEKLLNSLNPDLIISANTPTDPEGKILSYAKKKKIPFIFWVKDLRSLAIFSVLRKKFGFLGKAIGKYYIYKEKKLLHHSNYIVSLTDDFLRTFDGWKIKTPRSVIPDWTPIKDFPMFEKKNTFSCLYKLEDKFVVLYSGSLGLKHNPSIISSAAKELQGNENIIFLVISEGIGVKFLEGQIVKYNLSNMVILPFQDYNKLPQILGSSDVNVAILDDEASRYCVPSKVWTSYCSGKPILLVAPEENLVSRITTEDNCGIVIPPSSSNLFTEELMRLYKDKQLRNTLGGNARKYAEENFVIENIADEFEEIIENLIHESKLKS